MLEQKPVRGRYEEDGQFERIWMSKSTTIAEVLMDRTPENLKDAKPVIVFDGRVCNHSMILADFVPIVGGPLHITIQRFMGW